MRERHDLAVKELEKRLQLEKGRTSVDVCGAVEAANNPLSDASGSKLSGLNEELQRLGLQYDEAQATVRRHEMSIAAKQRELAEMESKQATNSKAREAVESAKAALQVRIDALTSDLAIRDQERSQHSAARQKLEKELDNLRKVMDAKSTEDIRRQEAEKSREVEMTRLREQSTALKLLDDQRETAQRLANQLRVDVEGLKTSHTTAQRDLKSAQANLKAKEEDLLKLQTRDGSCSGKATHDRGRAQGGPNSGGHCGRTSSNLLVKVKTTRRDDFRRCRTSTTI